MSGLTDLGMRLDDGHTPCSVRFLGVSPEEVLLESIILVAGAGAGRGRGGGV